MDWLNIHSSTLDSQEFVGSEPTQRATWLCLLRYCCGQENSGIIRGCSEWSDRRWQQLAKVTLREVHATCDLWNWTGTDLTVWAYPKEKEHEVRQNRTNGFLGGRPKNNHPVNHLDNHPVTVEETQQQTERVTQTEPCVITEGKGRERKGRERKGKEEEKEEGLGSSSVSRSNRKTIAPTDLSEPTRSRLSDIRTMFRGRLSTPWRQDELSAFRDAGLDSATDFEWADEIGALREYWLLAENLPTAIDYRRRDILTLLRHWADDVGKARCRVREHREATAQAASASPVPVYRDVTFDEPTPASVETNSTNGGAS